MKNKKKTTRKSCGRIYSKGQVNFLIDDLLHPLERDYSGAILLDELLHAINEHDLKVSMSKFARYSLPRIIRKVVEDL